MEQIFGGLFVEKNPTEMLTFFVFLNPFRSTANGPSIRKKTHFWFFAICALLHDHLWPIIRPCDLVQVVQAILTLPFSHNVSLWL